MSGPTLPPEFDGAAPAAAPAPLNALPIGTRIHEFEVTGIVGEGGFGIVYLAFDHSLHRVIALKEYMPSALAARTDGVSVAVRSERHQQTFEAGLRSFVNEARLLAQFDHPALVKVYRFWESNGTAYMAMPYYEGRTLKQILKDDPGFVTEARLKAILGPVLDALDLLHANQCYHRDVSPDNIMILKGGVPVLLDFGAARRIIGDMTQGLTVILKPGYAPIEQYADEGDLRQGPWSDIYAVSAVVFAAIVGKPPPTSVARIVRDPLEPLAKQGIPGYDPAFLAGIDFGLGVRPEQRPQSIAQFRQALGLPPGEPKVATSSAATTLRPGMHPRSGTVDAAVARSAGASGSAAPIAATPSSTGRSSAGAPPAGAGAAPMSSGRPGSPPASAARASSASAARAAPASVPERPLRIGEDREPPLNRARPSRDRLPTWIVAGGLALALAAVVGGFLMLRGGGAPPGSPTGPLQPETTASAPDQAKAEQAKAEQARAEQAKAEQAKAEQARAEQARAEQTRAEQARAEQARAEQARAEQARAEEQAKAEQARAEQARAEQARAEQARAEQARAEQAKAEQARAEQAKAEQAKALAASAQSAGRQESTAKSASVLPVAEDERVWESIKGSCVEAGFIAFVFRFPDSRYYPEARQRLDELQQRNSCSWAQGQESKAGRASYGSGPAAPVAPASPAQRSASAASTSAGTASASPSGTPPAKARVGTVLLQVRPWGEIYVDGVNRGVSPPLKSLDLEEGKHLIEIRNPGAASVSREVNVRRGQRVSISHQFK